MAEKKICNCCDEEKELSIIYWRMDKHTKDGFTTICKECKKKYDKKYYYEHEEKKREYRNSCERQEKMKIYHKDYYIENKEKLDEEHKFYREQNEEQISKYKKEYYEKNKNDITEHQKEYLKDERVRDRRRKYKNEYEKNRNREDMCYRMRNIISSCVRKRLRVQSSSKNNSSILKNLPYTMEELKDHLESQFEPWMNWDNYGIYKEGVKTWQIDHIMPQSKLLYDSMEHINFRTCWSLENLRPLETIVNIKKGNK